MVNGFEISALHPLLFGRTYFELVYLQSQIQTNNMEQDTTKANVLSGQELFTIQEVAEHLKISRTTLWKLTKEKGVKTLKVGGSVRYTQDGMAKLVGQS